MKSIILVAPPAAGKGTQSSLLCEKYGLVHISTGDLIREAIAKKDEMSDYLKSQIELTYIENNKLYTIKDCVIKLDPLKKNVYLNIRY